MAATVNAGEHGDLHDRRHQPRPGHRDGRDPDRQPAGGLHVDARWRGCRRLLHQHGSEPRRPVVQLRHARRRRDPDHHAQCAHQRRELRRHPEHGERRGHQRAGGATGNNSDPGDIDVLCAVIDIEKTANPVGPVNAGDTIGFDIVVSNSGDGVANDVSVTDNLPAGIDWSINPAVDGCSITRSRRRRGPDLHAGTASLAAPASRSTSRV